MRNDGSLFSLARAFIWFRVRLAVNTLRSGLKRDTGSRISRWAEVFVPILLGIALLPAAFLLAALALYAGWWMGTQPEIAPKIYGVPRAILGAAIAAAVIMPLATAMQGGFIASERLLLLPISRIRLHVINVLSRLADPILALLIPALVTFPIGFSIAGQWVTAAVTLILGLTFILLLLNLQSAVELLFQLVFRSRRRLEWFGILLMFGLSGAGLIPLLFRERSSEQQMAQSLVLIMDWVWSLIPSQFYAAGIQAQIEGHPDWALMNVLATALVAGLLFWFSLKTFGRLSENPAGTGARRRSGQGGWRSWRLPGLSPGTTAVAQVQLWGAVRSARGRMGLLTAPFMVVIFGMIGIFGEKVEFWSASFPISRGLLLALGGLAMSLLALQPILLNLFGTDRAGLSLQFLVPLTDRDLVKGKLLAILLLLSIPASLGTAAAFAIDPSGKGLLWLTIPFIGFSAFLMLGPLAVLLSVFFPKASDLSHWGQKGNPHTMAGLLGTLLVAPALGGPVGMAILAYFLGGVGWIWAGLLMWGTIAAMIGLAITKMASRLLGGRREALALAAQGR